MLGIKQPNNEPIKKKKNVLPTREIFVVMEQLRSLIAVVVTPIYACDITAQNYTHTPCAAVDVQALVTY